MRNTIQPILIATFLAVLPAAAAAQGTGPSCKGGAAVDVCDDAVCNQVVVKLQPNQAIGPVNASYGTNTLRSIPGRNTFLLQLPPNASPQTMLGGLSGDARVAWAELNYMMTAPNGGTQSFFLSASFNDYIGQVPMAIIGADEAHAWASGRNQIVAVLDTGVDPDHAMISGRLARGGFNYVDNNFDTRDIGNGIDDNNNGEIDELVGHGTMVSGLILRIAPRATVLPMRVLNCDGVGASFYVAQAIYDAVDNGATVINLSLGSIRPTQSIAAAVQAAHAQGVVVVAAAGNFDRSDPVYYPAGYPTVIGVAGTDWTDVKASFSDYGPAISISAPAIELASTFPGGLYATNSGNSMAAALVSGSAALLRSQNPALTPQQIESRLQAASAEIDPLNPGFSGLLGSGRLSIPEALAHPAVSRERR